MVLPFLFHSFIQSVRQIDRQTDSQSDGRNAMQCNILNSWIAFSLNPSCRHLLPLFLLFSSDETGNSIEPAAASRRCYPSKRSSLEFTPTYLASPSRSKRYFLFDLKSASFLNGGSEMPKFGVPPIASDFFSSSPAVFCSFAVAVHPMFRTSSSVDLIISRKGEELKKVEVVRASSVF